MFPHQFLIFHRHVAPAQTFCTVSHLIVQLKVVILHRDAVTADPRPVRADGRGGELGHGVRGLDALLAAALEAAARTPEHLPGEADVVARGDLAHAGQAGRVVAKFPEGQEPSNRLAVAYKLIAVNVDVGRGGGQVAEGWEREGGEGQHRERVELVFPEHEAHLGYFIVEAELRREAEEGFPLEAVEGVALDVAQPELHVEGGVVQVPEPVVCEGELVALHLDGVCGERGELRHAEHVELLAVADLDTEHRDSLKAAGENRKLLDELEVESHRDNRVHGDFPKVEQSGDFQIFEAVSADLELVDVGELDGVDRARLLGGAARLQQLRVDDHGVGVAHGEVLSTKFCEVSHYSEKALYLEVLHVVEEAAEELHVAAVLHVQRARVRRRLARLPHPPVQPQLEQLVVVAVAVHHAALATLNIALCNILQNKYDNNSKSIRLPRIRPCRRVTSRQCLHRPPAAAASLH